MKKLNYKTFLNLVIIVLLSTLIDVFYFKIPILLILGYFTLICFLIKFVVGLVSKKNNISILLNLVVCVAFISVLVPLVANIVNSSVEQYVINNKDNFSGFKRIEYMNYYIFPNPRDKIIVYQQFGGNKKIFNIKEGKVD